MKEPAFSQTINVKTAGVSKLALDQTVARLRASGRVKWKNKLVTKEAVVNAMWMWVGDMDPSVVEEAMSRYVPRLEAILRGEPDPGVGTVEPGGDSPPVHAQGQSVDEAGPSRRRGAG